MHIRDMLLLQEINADVYRQFMKGKFIITKTLNLFSKMAIDQAHEQENEKVKGEGGAVGITEDPAALLRWMVAGPEGGTGLFMNLWHTKRVFLMGRNIYITISLPPFRELFI